MQRGAFISYKFVAISLLFVWAVAATVTLVITQKQLEAERQRGIDVFFKVPAGTETIYLSNGAGFESNFRFDGYAIVKVTEK